MALRAARAIAPLTRLSLIRSHHSTQRRLIGALGEGVEEAASMFDSKPNFIHPTSLVHPNAVIGQGVSVGPFCTIGSATKVGDFCQLHPASHIFGNTELGDGCIVLTGAIVGAELPGRTVIGCNNIIGHHAVIGVKCQDMKYKDGDDCFLYIGNNNDVREYSSIHRSSKSSDKTVIGDNNLIMGSCHIAHDCKVGNNNIFANSTLVAGHVEVEVAQDVPRYMLVAGNRAELRGLNLEGLRRHGFTGLEIECLRRAYRKIFMPTDANSCSIIDRLDKVQDNEELAHVAVVSSMVQSIRDCFGQSRRGICRNGFAKEA
ncbi:probable acyl-[acyl-carrier-protein]--UDP-N-acetylglucosamine O-acyltransferase, mitochondrial isoform X2 [Amborella trichopoda]|uniref:probable acyl-[acyl-carrier-protein]--UDP-N-acetylglucosamine O-acyltransferase, mitochondrial isoform X2 n=1 Tax=Amborella trichopoda TaxID=13333 RepID=UPI0009BFC0AF|nr:probable acyl-[acyl-carrier-protein]--UDP-N-acetylglucosamine O-acyltransferase, mitochondrial isoform X2 [Amborella trichopoda]|eukprot:XP_020528677.1 probable acyl-[acyl-carrier-protein]--UDP-N-acetylglucosamine O-acyltransferase, mitochondrial isoform X2 [Amborella trichopoda]